MDATITDTCFRKVAYFLGFVQAVSYAVLAAICIGLYLDGTKTLEPRNHMEVVNGYMYYLFLSHDEISEPKLTLHPAVFTGFAWVYLILHLLWLGVSAYCFNKERVVEARNVRAWSYLTLFISLWDFITVVILGTDYGKCLDWAEAHLELEGVCADGILPVLSIATRGFVLWCLNVVFGLILNKMALNLTKGASPVQQNIAPTGVRGEFPTYPPTSPVSYSQYPPKPQETPQYNRPSYIRPISQPPRPSPYVRQSIQPHRPTPFVHPGSIQIDQDGYAYEPTPDYPSTQPTAPNPY